MRHYVIEDICPDIPSPVEILREREFSVLDREEGVAKVCGFGLIADMRQYTFGRRIVIGVPVDS
jgi:hypothetical protein